MKVIELRPDLGHCWVRYAFRPWPGNPDLWLDLSSGGLGRGSQDEGLPTEYPVSADLDDVAYLPPVTVSQAQTRIEWARRLGLGGAPVLVQSLPGAEIGLPGVSEVFDVLHAVVTGELSKLGSLSTGAKVVWPLVGGYSDEPELREAGLEQLAEAGAACVQGVTARLVPADRRRVVEVAGEHGFERLFHGPEPSEREFAAAVDRFGMDPFLTRPLPDSPSRLVNNRRLAGVLAEIGELWLRLGRTESRGQGFYRAARWIDSDNHDLMALAREGNLGVVTWLDEQSRRVIQELSAQNHASLLQELRAEYLGAG